MNGEDTVTERCNDAIDQYTLIMVLALSFVKQRASDVVSKGPTKAFNGGNTSEPEGGLEGLQRVVETYKAEIVPGFANAPLNQEQVSAVIEFVEIGLQDCMKRMAGQHPFGYALTEASVARVIEECEGAIDDLQNAFEVPDTKPLEQVRDTLQAWLDELDRQHVPHPSYPAGPV